MLCLTAPASPPQWSRLAACSTMVRCVVLRLNSMRHFRATMAAEQTCNFWWLWWALHLLQWPACRALAWFQAVARAAASQPVLPLTPRTRMTLAQAALQGLQAPGLLGELLQQPSILMTCVLYNT